MTGIPKHLARKLDVRLQTRIVALRCDPDGCTAIQDDGMRIHARAVVLTPPTPQSLAILDAGDFDMTPFVRKRAQAIEYAPCLAVMALLDGPSDVPSPGGFNPQNDAVAWIADNHQKGVSAVPAVTVHATPAFSSEHWTWDRREAGHKLLRAAESWLGSHVSEFEVHGWRYSLPIRSDPSFCLPVSELPQVILAGDAFGGSRVESAVRSGWAAADALIHAPR
jgi:predicted NAD/FAD-dependent oxidoreductase